MKHRLIINTSYYRSHVTMTVMRLLTIVVLSLFAVGCAEREDGMDEVLRAESMLEENPKEALAIMQRVDRSEIEKNSDVAR